MLKIFKRLGSVNSRFKVRSVNFFLLLSVLWLCLIGFPGGVSAQVVDIPDPGLRAAIARALNKVLDEDITRAEMEMLVSLEAILWDITDLRCIEFAINLTELYLGGNTISTIDSCRSRVIYNVDGQSVRTLALGHQPAEVYHSKQRAAYWNRKNETGEPVASGLYFYTLTAGDFLPGVRC